MKSMLKKMVAVFCLLVAMVATTEAQNSFAYQAVIRNAKGELVINKEVSMRFSLLFNEKVVYSETHKTKTNQYGNVQVSVGTGTVVSGSFAAVPWNSMNVWMRIEVDPNGGENYIDLGAIQLQPAPYAMFAQSATNVPMENSSPKSDSDALFEVKDKDGNVVFAVYRDGVRVYVDDAEGKPKATGFAVAGRKAAKDGEEADLFTVNAEGTQVFVEDAEGKPKATGFAVAGRKAAKDGSSDLFTVSSTGTQVYIDEARSSKPKATGFAVAGRKANKGDDKYLEVTTEGTHVYIDDADGKPKATGFAVSGRKATKGEEDNKYMEITADGTQIFVDDANGKPKATGFAVAGRKAAKGSTPKLFEVNDYGTKIYIDDAGSGKPKATGFAVAGRKAAKDDADVKYMVIDASGTRIYVDYEEAKAMQTGFAVAGRKAAKDGTPNTIFKVDEVEGTRVYIDDIDGKPKATGFAVAGRKAAKEGEPLYAQITSNSATFMVEKALSVQDKNTDQNMMSMTNDAVKITTEVFGVAEPTSEDNTLSTSKDEGLKIADNAQVVVTGDMSKTVDAEEIKAEGDAQLPEPVEVFSQVVEVKCSEYAELLGEVSGYEFLKIYGDGLFAKNGKFDTDTNAIIMFDAKGDLTTIHSQAVLTVILQDPDSYEDAKMIFWPLKQINTLIVNFGLMAAGSNGKYLNVQAVVNSNGGINKVDIKSNNDKWGEVEIDGLATYGGLITATAKPKKGYEFKYWLDELTGDYRYANPRTISVGRDSINLTAYFELARYNVSFLADPRNGGEIKVILNDSGMVEDWDDEPDDNQGTNQEHGGGNGGSTSIEIEGYTLGYYNNFTIEDCHYAAKYTLVARPAQGFKFVSWNGDPKLTDTTLTVNIVNDTVVKAWFEPETATKPFGGKAAVLPGVIEGENFDEGEGAYNNQDAGTSWQASRASQPYAYDIAYRSYDENKIGIDSIFTGEYALSFTDEGDWYEYTVNVEKEQKMRWAVRYANLYNEGAQISITRGNEAVTGAVNARTTAGWWVYNMVSGETKNALPAGESKLRLNFTQLACNVDKMMFGKADDVLLSIDVETIDGNKLEGDKGWMAIGTVDGYGFYAKGTKVTVTATPDEGYVFAGWNDGDKNAKREITLTEDTRLDAYFAESDEYDEVTIEIYTNLKADDEGNDPIAVYENGLGPINYWTMPELQDDGNYLYTYKCIRGSSVVLKATSKEEFSGWYDNTGEELVSESAEYKFTAEEDDAFYAIYKKKVEQQEDPNTDAIVSNKFYYRDADEPIERNQWFSQNQSGEKNNYVFDADMLKEMLGDETIDYCAAAVFVSEDNGTDSWGAQFCTILQGLPNQIEENSFELQFDALWIPAQEGVEDNATIKFVTGKEDGVTPGYQFGEYNTELIESNHPNNSTEEIANGLKSKDWTLVTWSGTIGYGGENQLEMEYGGENYLVGGQIGLQINLVGEEAEHHNYGTFLFRNVVVKMGGKVVGRYFVPDGGEGYVSLGQDFPIGAKNAKDNQWFFDGQDYEFFEGVPTYMKEFAAKVGFRVAEGYSEKTDETTGQTIREPNARSWYARFCNKLTGLKGQQIGARFKFELEGYWVSADYENVKRETAKLTLCTGLGLPDGVNADGADNTQLVDVEGRNTIYGTSREISNGWTTVSWEGYIGEQGKDAIGLSLMLVDEAESDRNNGSFYFRNVKVYIDGEVAAEYFPYEEQGTDDSYADPAYTILDKYTQTCALSGLKEFGKKLTITSTGQVSDNHFDPQYNVTAIANRALASYNLENPLEEVVIEAFITEIGDYAFANCMHLTNINIPSTIERVGMGAFKDCPSLNFNEYDNAYYLGNPTNPHLVLVKAKSTDITSCLIHEDCKIVCTDAFDGCDALDYNEDNQMFYLGTDNSTNRYTWLIKAKKDIRSGTVNSNCRFIADTAFKDCSLLESISIPSSVERIGYGAFNNCRGLESVIYESIESLCSIKFDKDYGTDFPDYDNPGHSSNPLSYAHKLMITGKDVTEVEIRNVNSIGDYAFQGCTNITKVSFTSGSNVATIGREAFSGCEALATVNWEQNNKALRSIGYKAFANCSFPTISLPEGLECVSERAFENCKNLVSAIIPSSVQYMGEGVFNECDSPVVFCLETDATKSEEDDNDTRFAQWDQYWNQFCGAVVREYRQHEEYRNIVRYEDDYENELLCLIYRPDENFGSGNINEDALLNITTLREGETISEGEAIVIGYNGNGFVVVPEKAGDDGAKAMANYIVGIARYAFYGKNIESFTVGEDGSKAEAPQQRLRFIGQGAFCNAGEKLAVTFNVGSNRWYRWKDGDDAESCTLDGYELLYNGCEYEYYYVESKSHIFYVQPDTYHEFTELGTEDYPFSYLQQAINAVKDSCEMGYTDFTIRFLLMGSGGKKSYAGDSIQNHYGGAPSFAEQIASLLLDDAAKHARLTVDFSNVEFNGFYSNAFYWDEDGCDGLPNLVGLVLPEGITDIREGAFRNCENLDSLYIPSTVRSIDGSAFYKCGNLSNVIFEGNEFYTLSEDYNGGKALYKIEGEKTELVLYCTKTIGGNFDVPASVYKIGENAFFGAAVSEVNFEGNVTTIGNNAFAQCVNLMGIQIADVTELGSDAFDGCVSLTSVTIPSGLTEISDNCFANTGLVNIEIPDNISAIGMQAFYNCSNIESITIPASVQTIGSGVFCYCNKLTSESISVQGDDVWIRRGAPGNLRYVDDINQALAGSINIDSEENNYNGYERIEQVQLYVNGTLGTFSGDVYNINTVFQQINDPTKEYVINISGTIEKLDITSNKLRKQYDENVPDAALARSIVLRGVDYAKIDAGWEVGGEINTDIGSALNIETEVPVVIDNLTITGGCAEYGGGINVDTDADVIICGGVVIFANYARYSGGGIYSYGTVTITDTKIYNNEAGYSGGGIDSNGSITIGDDTKIYLNHAGNSGAGVEVGGTFVMNGNAEITTNSLNNNDYGNGAGVYIGSGDSFTMNGGTISGNSLYSSSEEFKGTGVYVSESSTFEMGGTARVNDDVFLDNGATITIISDFTDSDQVATITLDEYSYGNEPQVLTDNEFLKNNYSRFGVSNDYYTVNESGKIVDY